MIWTRSLHDSMAQLVSVSYSTNCVPSIHVTGHSKPTTAKMICKPKCPSFANACNQPSHTSLLSMSYYMLVQPQQIWSHSIGLCPLSLVCRTQLPTFLHTLPAALLPKQVAPGTQAWWMITHLPIALGWWLGIPRLLCPCCVFLCNTLHNNHMTCPKRFSIETIRLRCSFCARPCQCSHLAIGKTPRTHVPLPSKCKNYIYSVGLGRAHERSVCFQIVGHPIEASVLCVNLSQCQGARGHVQFVLQHLG